MSRQTARFGVLGVLLAGLCGCGSARYVTVDGNGGIVAIPTNVNAWPYNHREKAEELMAKKCPQGYTIEREEEVVVGQTQHTNTETKTTGHPVLAALKVDPMEEKVSQTTSYSDKTEWRIWFHGN